MGDLYLFLFFFSITKREKRKEIIRNKEYYKGVKFWVRIGL